MSFISVGYVGCCWYYLLHLWCFLCVLFLMKTSVAHITLPYNIPCCIFCNVSWICGKMSLRESISVAPAATVYYRVSLNTNTAFVDLVINNIVLLNPAVQKMAAKRESLVYGLKCCLNLLSWLLAYVCKDFSSHCSNYSKYFESYI